MDPTIICFLKTCNYKTLIIILISLFSTYLCSQLGFVADFPLTIIYLAISFPIIFSINSAYWRRERALQRLADFKSNGLAIYFATRDWPASSDLKLPEQTQKHLTELYEALSTFLLSSGAEIAFNRQAFYEKFSNFSTFLQNLREVGLKDAELSQVDKYLNEMIESFDRIKNIFEYRTPAALRACGKLFILLFPIIYGPYFAFRVENYPFGLAYFLAALYSFALVSLDNIQDELESPYDQTGEDDIKLDSEEFNMHMSIE